MPSRREPVRIGNGQGFWGDSARGPLQLVGSGAIDYLTMDFLAEVTMSIMQKSKSRNPAAGYATDFVAQLEQVLPMCQERGIRIIANAGGVNPQSCAAAVADVATRLGLTGIKIATVSGDDILDQMPSLLAGGELFTNMDTGEPLAPHAASVQSANVYLGAGPIIEALQEGADIVITGRVADAALVVAPLVHEFGWGMDDYDKLGAAIVAGHIIECGTQCTGGNFSRWRDVPDMANIGYPIVEGYADGTFVITKPQGTGGLVDVDTVTAQLLYEIGDPSRYITPDVVADFTTLSLEQVGPDRVRVSGVQGMPPTDTYKVSISSQRGWKSTAQLTVGGPDAGEKARFTADLLFSRLAGLGVSFADQDHRVEVIGTNALYPGMLATPVPEPCEVVLRVSLRSAHRSALDRMAAEFASVLTSGPPGLTGFAGGRPRVSEVVGFWPALIDKARVAAVVNVIEVDA
jgi:hypothetical protein